MTKPQVAVGALALTERERLRLFAQVSDYFPEVGAMKVGVPQPDGSIALEPQKRPIRIHDLWRRPDF